MSQSCQGLNCLQIAPLSEQFVMKLLTGRAPLQGLERQTRSEVKAERIGGGELVHLTAASLTQDTCVGCEVRLISGLPGGLDTCNTEFVTPAPNYLLSSLTALSHALKEQRDCQFWTCR